MGDDRVMTSTPTRPGMVAQDGVVKVGDSHRGILARPDELTYQLRRLYPSEDLAWCVERYWVVEWNRPDGQPGEGRVLPNPNVNVALENGELTAHGIATNVFERSLTGAGRVFGIKFRPGGFRPFSDRSVHGLTDRVRPAGDVLPGAATLEAELLAGGDDDEQRDAVERYLRGRQVDPDPRCADVNAMTDALVGNPDIRRVADVLPLFDIGERALQRLFREYLGVTPRWVLRRARLHAAAERVVALAMEGSTQTWADVAIDLGYVDQAHFIHDFKAATGETPARWAAALTG